MNSKPLRIMVILPMYGGSLPIGNYCVQALRDLGHSVRVFDAPQLYPASKGIRKLDLSPSGITSVEKYFFRMVSQAIWTQAQEQQPQLVLAMAQAPLDRNLLQRFKQTGTRTVMWFVEDYKVFNYWLSYAPLYDAFAVIQKEPFLDLLRKAGQEHAFYLPLAALPEFHKPVSLTPAEIKEYGSSLSFLGAGYPNRRLAFRPLAGKDFKIWGSDWENEKILEHNIQREGKRIDTDESVKIYNAAKININLHSSLGTENLVSGGDFVNPRTFELAAMGSFQIVDKRSLMSELFETDELATFESMEEFYESIEHFLSNPQERNAYADKARARVLKDHTYQRRMETLIEYMEKSFGPWKDDEKDECVFPDLEPQLKTKLLELAAKLGLSPKASFNDIVARLRQQNGVLNDVETAILFLDEWRKQYSPQK